MSGERVPPHGRGAAANPGNRFERLHYETDPADPDGPQPGTIFLKDTSRSLITYNDSPDVGFSASINPYRGCEHGCAYCLDGQTPILMADGGTKPLQELEVGDAIYGTIRRGWYRRYVVTRVLARWEVEKPAYRVMLEDGTQLIAGGDHRFLTERGWKFVIGSGQEGCRPHLTSNNKLMGTGAFTAPTPKDADYQTGYLCGMVRGDGMIGHYTYACPERGGGGTQHQFRLALCDDGALLRTAEYLRNFGVATHPFIFSRASETRKLLRAVRTHAGAAVARVQALISWPESPTVAWSKGFLAGAFDAEGSYCDGCWRLSNTDPEIIDHVSRGLRMLGFAFVLESQTKDRAKPITAVRLRGGLRDRFRFFHATDPAISRKRNIDGLAVKSDAKLRVIAVEPLGVRPLVDITTGTGDFIANGVVSHNCYARPTHEYLGFSAGLDFETRIMVKEDAPTLLRRELSSPRWRPQALGVSGVTDPYQPVERRLGLTRRCLEVLAEFRNPAALVTKNHLVTRDVDLLQELARHRAGAVFLSVTTLDADLAGALEPRASRPAGRLAAVEELARAGVPVGVLVAPVIPGLTDHEMPAILAAAGRAGARYAGYIPVRLPHGVAPLFEQWLGRHFPEKKDKVLGRIRALRGGRLNDPRFNSRMRGEGPFAALLRDLFRLSCERAGIVGRGPELSTAAFRRPGGSQPHLF